MPIVCFRERNNWEGETWRWFVPVADEAMKDIEKIDAIIREGKVIPPYCVLRDKAGALKTYSEVQVEQWLAAVSSNTYRPAYQRLGPIDSVALLAALETADDVDTVMYKGTWARTFLVDI